MRQMRRGGGARGSGGPGRGIAAAALAAGAALAGCASGAAGNRASAASGLPAEEPPAYEELVGRYRLGDFTGAVAAATDRFGADLLDEAANWPEAAGAPSVGADLDLLAAALLHFDLAASGVSSEANEEVGRGLLEAVTPARRDAWLRAAHLGLLGAYAMAPRLPDAARVSQFLTQRYRSDPVVRFTRARLVEVLGWAFHDDRFLDQARADYRGLLRDPLTGRVGLDPAEIRVHLAHTLLRDGEPSEALRELERVGGALSESARFAALLVRGEALLWLDRTAEAVAVFAEARELDPGAGSASAGLVAAHQLSGDPDAAAEAVERFLSTPCGGDLWQDFLHRGLWNESVRLRQFRRLVSGAP